MATLQQSYVEWVLDEPGDLENDHPTDEEMAAFEEAEREHKEQVSKRYLWT